jgi:hypothetical protein
MTDDDRFRPRTSVFIPKDWHAQHFYRYCLLDPLPCGALAQEKEGVGRVGGITGGQVDITI